MSELDLTDPYVRDMADLSHRPEQIWSLGGKLLSVHCDECGNNWPCPTRVRLDEIASR